MDSTQDISVDKWQELKGRAQRQWGKLTSDDHTRIRGSMEELSGTLQQRYGYGKAQAKLEIDSWLLKQNPQS